MRFFKSILLIGFVISIATSCKKEFEGDALQLDAPETFLAVDSIYRSGNTRYTTTIEAHWWAVPTTGYIKGYEVSIDNQQTWSYTNKQSGTFLLTLPVGADTANIKFFVRAIDSRGMVDPTPASVSYPVRNSAPSIQFDFSSGQKLVSFPAFRYNWNFIDVDGVQDISTVEVALNDTVNHLIQLPATVTGATFVAERVNQTYTGNYILYNNAQTTAYTQKLSGALFNDTNRIYVRCLDRSGSKSEWVMAKIFIRQPKSGLLYINDYVSNKSIVTNFYSNRITALGASYSNFDVVKVFLDEFPSDAFTTTKTFEFFDRIVWTTDDPTRSLGTAQTATIPFFNKGGKIFMVLEIPNDVALDANFFNFTPIEKLVDNPGRTFRMATGDLLTPYNASWPTLKATGIVTYPRPFYTYTSSSGLYSYDSLASAQLKSFGSGNPIAWTGPSNVMAKRNNTQTGKTDFVTLTVPLHLMNGNNNADSFFNKVVISELQF